MLKFYLTLQARRLHRMVVGMGGYPILNYLVVVSVFLFISYLLYFNNEHFSLSYSLIALMVVIIRGKTDYFDFLKLTFSEKDYYLIRIIENALIAFPFLHFLLFSGKFVAGLILLILSVLLVFFNPRVRWQRAIPTPFGKYPFEFTTGFRIAFPVILMAYYLVYVSLHYRNPGIGIFTVMLICFTCTAFYIRVEDEFFVWIFSSNAKSFLWEKIRIALLSTLALCLPVLIALALANPDKILLILAFQVWGLCFVFSGVVCKYSTFPGEIGTKEGLLTFFSAPIPPMLFFTIPYLYIKAIKNLKGILE